MSECLKEVQTNDKRPVKRLSPKMESPVHAECLIACVLKRNGVIIKGKINKGNVSKGLFVCVSASDYFQIMQVLIKF